MNMETDLGFLTMDEYVSRRSPTLIVNPQAKLNEYFEIDNYLSRQDQNYLEEIKQLSDLDSHPLSKHVKIIVTIIAYNEGARIPKTLENYISQDLPRNQFEIIILDNHPESVQGDNTADEVRRFQEANKSISVIYAHKIWEEGEHATGANARKHVFDIALTRIHERGKIEDETILISNDADTLHIAPNYLSSIIEEFKSNDTLDALIASAVVPPYVIKKPNLYAALILWDILDELTCEGEPFYLRGASSAYRASVYSAFGGYNPKAKLAGDLETGWLIADARDWNPRSIIKFTKTQLLFDPRRILQATASRVTLFEMYINFVSNPEIRNADNKALLRLIPNNLDWEMLQEELNGFWNWRNTGMYKWKNEDFDSIFKKALTRLGIDYEIVDDSVKLKNVDKFLFIYKEDFGGDIQIIHSEERKPNKEKYAQIIEYFSSLSDGAIESKKRLGKLTNVDVHL